ncbi:DUF2061 domain-containing protein [Notoacmeibacter ruber]|uniref:DUF2061 domain-containing protein n=1 Tax=Notoacmeibacter ruber TaxID=2670375 RepID=A0A3L7JHR1_9HYPH|nr:DUF2061 domain-containing protein [Notoacmeibacter ruber]RLQ89161.1 DUF2061 domain-containing protein [Notoacmeibacter ruber]
METRKRSLVKAVSWQAWGLLMMVLLGFFFTGSISAGGQLALLSTAIGFLCYLLHERLWAAIHWGMVGRSNADTL